MVSINGIETYKGIIDFTTDSTGSTFTTTIQSSELVNILIDNYINREYIVQGEHYVNEDNINYISSKAVSLSIIPSYRFACTFMMFGSLYELTIYS